MPNAGVIGLGVGQDHIRGFRAAGWDVPSVYDLDAEKMIRMGWDCRYYRMAHNLQAFLQDDDVSMVGIASPYKAHLNQVIEALLRGKHVFCEKPLCIYEVGLELIRAAHERRSELKLAMHV